MTKKTDTSTHSQEPLQQSPAPGSDPGQTTPGAPFEGGRPDEEDIFPDQSPGGETEADPENHAARGE